MWKRHSILICCTLFAFYRAFTTVTPVQAAEVLMVQWFEHSMADLMFEQELRQLRPDVKIRYINAKRDKKLLKALLKVYDFRNTDLVHTLGTDGTKIVKEHLKGRKPIVFNAVSTPELSGIVRSISKPGGNMTGARMLVDLETQIEVLREITNMETLGVWYDPRELQSQTVLLQLKKIADKKGIVIRPFRIIPDAKFFEGMVKYASKESEYIDALYFIASSSFHSTIQKLHRRLPDELVTMGVLRHYVESGSTFALSSNHRKMVKELANRAHRILNGEKAGEMPIAVHTRRDAVLYVNKKKLNAAGIKKVRGLGVNIEIVD